MNKGRRLHHKATLTDKQVQHLLNLWRQGYKPAQLSEWFGISSGYVSRLVNGKARTHAPQETPAPPPNLSHSSYSEGERGGR